MDLDIKVDVTVNLSAKQVEQIVNNYVARETKGRVTNVTFDLKNEWHGYGYSEEAVMKFNGAKVSVDMSNKAKMNSSLVAQIAAVESDPRQYGDK